MSLEMILSIIGIINGTLAWYFSYKTYKKDKAKLNIHVFHSYCLKANEYYNFFVLIDAEITNNSSQPITINEIYLNKENGIYLASNNSKFTNDELNYINKTIIRLSANKFTKQLVYGKKINPYDSITVTIPFKIYGKTIGEKAMLEVKTSRKTFKKSFKFTYFHF